MAKISTTTDLALTVLTEVEKHGPPSVADLNRRLNINRRSCSAW